MNYRKNRKALRTAADFMERVQKTETCWLWIGAHHPFGYGEFGVDDKKRSAHVASYEFFIGPVPAGAHVCHRCDNPPCVNPEHLYAGSYQTNTKDRMARGRQARCESNGMSKLTRAIIEAARQERATLGTTVAVLGARYGVAQSTMSRALSGVTWTHS